MALTRRQLIQIATASSLPLAGCAGSGSSDGGTGGGGENNGDVKETSQVSMTGRQFQPRNIHVAVGTTVTWTNEGSYEHTVTSASDNWSFDKSVPVDGSVEHTFDNSGVFDVYCTIHGSSDLSGMSMKIAVGDATIESPLGGGDGSDSGGAYG